MTEKKVAVVVTARQSYIDLLKPMADACHNYEYEARQAQLASELIAAGYMRGHIVRDQDGASIACSTIEITVKGRLFLQELEEKEAAESPLGRIKKYGALILGVAIGVLAPVVSQWLTEALVK